MKRHLQLQPLSRQHHNGLLMALLLTKGLKKGATLAVMCDFICHIRDDELKEHFEAEESLLVPVLQKKSFSLTLTQHLLEDHHYLRSLIEMAKDQSASENDIRAFATSLEKHIRFEEKIYFPKAEEILNETELEEIGKFLHDDRSKNCINYPIRFWE